MRERPSLIASAAPVVLLLALFACKGPDTDTGVDHEAPAVAILAPADGASFELGEPVEFAALVVDYEDDPGDLQITWESDRDGILDQSGADASGEVRFTTVELTLGAHAILLTVVDTDGLNQEASLGLTVVPATSGAPTIDVLSPESDAFGVVGEPFTFEVRVGDDTTAASDLTLAFASDLDDEFCTPIADTDGLAACDAELSEGLHELTFTVADPDGHVTTATQAFEVLSPDDVDDDGDGYTENDGDCADDEPLDHPGAIELVNGRDDDCDGFVDNHTDAWDDDADGFSEDQGDCDDTDGAVSPAGTEVCDSRDQDCDGTVDEGTLCFDDDLDGFTEDQGDCDDTTAATAPGAPEAADGVDNDCDGISDEGTERYDADGDCWCPVGPCSASVEAACTAIDPGDCDDTNADVHPGASEAVADAVDQDCDGLEACYADADQDGFRTVDLALSADLACTLASGVADGSADIDCDDTDADVNPDALEGAGDTVDQDCDGTELCYDDLDHDGWRATTVTVSSDLDCLQADGEGLASDPVDCDDGSAVINGGNAEIIGDGLDQDCDGGDLCWLDLDRDGFRSGSDTIASADLTCDTADGEALPAATIDCDDADDAVWPGAPEITGSGIDEDCDRNEICYVDADRDGYRTSATVINTAGTCTTPDGEALATAELDCDDRQGDVNAGATESPGNGTDDDCDGVELCYVDSDGDGYRSATVTVVSVDLACTAAAGEAPASAAQDCYDLNDEAHPLQTAYFDVDRGDGSFDYNCDGVTTIAYSATATYSCTNCHLDANSNFVCDALDGWVGGRPACGSDADWGSGWEWSGTCSPYETVTYTQSCK